MEKVLITSSIVNGINGKLKTEGLDELNNLLNDHWKIERNETITQGVVLFVLSKKNSLIKE